MLCLSRLPRAVAPLTSELSPSSPRLVAPFAARAGTYYKNVRSEWASIVATPPQTGFQDALAFTRSLGDLHLQSYGVSHTPETFFMDLTRLVPLEGSAAPAAAAVSSAPPPLLRDSPIVSPADASPVAAGGSAAAAAAAASAAEAAAATEGAAAGQLADSGAAAGDDGAAAVREAPLVGHPIALCVSSDGIWDNWRFEDVASFLNAPARLDRAVQSGKADQACTELMAENLTRARSNFGSSADNMSCIVIYLVPRAAAL